MNILKRYFRAGTNKVLFNLYECVQYECRYLGVPFPDDGHVQSLECLEKDLPLLLGHGARLDG
jgi:hypothetical protein